MERSTQLRLMHCGITNGEPLTTLSPRLFPVSHLWLLRNFGLAFCACENNTLEFVGHNLVLCLCSDSYTLRYSSQTNNLYSDPQAWESVTIPAEVTGYWLRGLKPNTRYYYALRNEATDSSSGRFTEVLNAYSGEAKCK